VVVTPASCGCSTPTRWWFPDFNGNNRLDNLRKIADNPRVALLCMVPGIDETLRIYGRAELRRPPIAR
jgi:predicted pyridoxine 5'-phosphate oxidase superfamily flavin-nucleotide-binding protein